MKVLRDFGALHGQRVRCRIRLSCDDAHQLVPQLGGDWDGELILNDTKTNVWVGAWAVGWLAGWAHGCASLQQLHTYLLDRPSQSMARCLAPPVPQELCKMAPATTDDCRTPAACSRPAAARTT